MENLPLKYLGYGVTLQEVPNEISLVINVSGCPYKCKGCHSQYLWEYDGEYLSEELKDILDFYEGMITCVCFMGGNQNTQELLEHLKAIKEKNLKTCLYSGCESLNNVEILLPHLDWVKIGRYDKSLRTDDNVQYGIKLATSNQHIYKKGVDY
jgi:anaerobic ribonucleoside-triphosphate reductase activating protein